MSGAQSINCRARARRSRGSSIRTTCATFSVFGSARWTTARWNSNADARPPKPPEPSRGVTPYKGAQRRSHNGSLASKIRRLCLWQGEQVLLENIAVVLGAYRFQQLVLHLAPPLDHVKRFVERVGIVNDHVGFKCVGVPGQLEALNHVLFFRVRRAQIVDVAV